MQKKKLALAVVATTALLALAGCSAPSKGGSAGSSGTVTYSGYGGTGQDAENAAWYEPFTKESGIKVATDDTSSWSKIVEMEKADKVTWDVAQGAITQGVTKNRYLADIDCKVVDCSAFDGASFPAYKQAVPLFTFSFVLAYNTKTFTGADKPTSMADFFDPSVKATRVLPETAGAWEGILEAALLSDGVKRADLYPLDVDRALKVLDRIKDQTQVLASDSDCAQKVSSGEAQMGLCYNGRVAIAAQEGDDIDAAWGQQVELTDYIYIPKDSPNPKGAQKLVAYIVKHEGAISKQIPYSAASTKAPTNVASKWADWTPTGNAKTGADAPIIPNADWWNKNTSSVLTRITEWASS